MRRKDSRNEGREKISKIRRNKEINKVSRGRIEMRVEIWPIIIHAVIIPHKINQAAKHQIYHLVY